MTPTRDRAKGIMDAMLPAPVRSNDGTGNYSKYTAGLTHETMAANWKTGGILTSCNAFVGWYASQFMHRRVDFHHSFNFMWHSASNDKHEIVRDRQNGYRDCTPLPLCGRCATALQERMPG